jgi:hypothetical protein
MEAYFHLVAVTGTEFDVAGLDRVAHSFDSSEAPIAKSQTSMVSTRRSGIELSLKGYSQMDRSFQETQWDSPRHA